ncbi:hypothetical protein [Pararhodospirillum photometricum]|nr:hypothetical protein [Pararhodospirillum photometricum]
MAPDPTPSDRLSLRLAIDYLRRQAESLGFLDVAALLEQARRCLDPTLPR